MLEHLKGGDHIETAGWCSLRVVVERLGVKVRQAEPPARDLELRAAEI